MLFLTSTDESGYNQRKEIVAAIKEDAKKQNYPCVAVSYITSPGNNMGYRYLFWLADLHVNNPKSLSPIYTIVFPPSLVGESDMQFGALGLVLPDYERYDEEGIKESYSGENSNLTDPLFWLFLK